jgi:hypothetical protein
MQTRIYPFVLVEAGAEIFGGAIQPEQVSLVCWFAAQPDRPEVFAYSADQHEETRRFLSQMIHEATTRNEETWPLTADEKLCGYCVYRSLCNRGVAAGGFEELDTEIDEALEIDLGSVDEIAF